MLRSGRLGRFVLVSVYDRLFYYVSFLFYGAWFGFLCIIRVLSGRPGLDWVHDWDWDGMFVKSYSTLVIDHCYKALLPRIWILCSCMVIRRSGDARGYHLMSTGNGHSQLHWKSVCIPVCAEYRISIP